jgi:hypothetical protein
MSLIDEIIKRGRSDRFALREELFFKLQGVYLACTMSLYKLDKSSALNSLVKDPISQKELVNYLFFHERVHETFCDLEEQSLTGQKELFYRSAYNIGELVQDISSVVEFFNSRREFFLHFPSYHDTSDLERSFNDNNTRSELRRECRVLCDLSDRASSFSDPLHRFIPNSKIYGHGFFEDSYVDLGSGILYCSSQLSSLGLDLG